MLSTVSSNPLSSAELMAAITARPDMIPIPHGLLEMMQELSHARDLESIITLMRERARAVTGADGITVVMKDGDQCHYIEEDATGPLWKGRKFPLTTCISGWSMLNKKAVAIADIYRDDRIPHDAYRPTFVKSLVMLPIRRSNPIGAIGVYWADHRQVSDAEITFLQALADSVSVAMENVALYTELQSKIKDLQDSNHELSRFAWIASHDLQEPLRTITTQVELLGRRYGEKLDERARHYITTATTSARSLQELVQDLLVHAQIRDSEHFKPMVLSEVVQEVLDSMQMAILESGAEITVDELPWVWGERTMIARLFQNLISNAIKFRKPGLAPVIHLGCVREEGTWHFTVRDEGIGIEHDQHARIFGLFQRIHPQSVYPGSGIGLATCKKIVEMHDGKLWVDSAPDQGSTFHIVLPLSGDILIAPARDNA